MNELKPAAPSWGAAGFCVSGWMWRTTAAPSAGGRQPGLRTVQGSSKRLLELLIRRPSASRWPAAPDAGVHARGQVVHLDLTEAEWLGLNRGAELIPPSPARADPRRPEPWPGGPQRCDRGAPGERGARRLRCPLLGPLAPLFSTGSRTARRSGTRSDGPRPSGTRTRFDVALLNEGAASCWACRISAPTASPARAPRPSVNCSASSSPQQRRRHCRPVTTRSATTWSGLVGAAAVRGGGHRGPGLGSTSGSSPASATPKSGLAAPHPLVLEEVAYPSDSGLLARPGGALGPSARRSGAGTRLRERRYRAVNGATSRGAPA